MRRAGPAFEASPRVGRPGSLRRAVKSGINPVDARFAHGPEADERTANVRLEVQEPATLRG